MVELSCQVAELMSRDDSDDDAFSDKGKKAAVGRSQQNKQKKTTVYDEQVGDSDDDRGRAHGNGKGPRRN
jgi:hypothetical protein